MKTKALNVILYLFLAIMWFVILFISCFFLLLNNVVDHFGNGILKNIFILVYICGFILPIIFHKKLKSNYMLPLCLILATVLSTIINGVIYNSVDNYISVYSREKWNDNAELRFHMIDNLEKQFDFIGKTEQEIKDILGEPSNTIEYDGWRVFEYYIGNDYIDAYTYDFRFEKGFVINSGIVQH